MPWLPDEVSLPDEMMEFDGTQVPGPFKQQDIHIGRLYMPSSFERFSYIKPGGNRHDLPDRLKSPCWRKHSTGSGDVLGRLEWNKPSVTIRTEFFKPEKGRYLHPAADRALTHAEAASIQGFDDRHLWSGSKIEIARMIGNAVPPPLAVAVGKQVVRALGRH
jgi:DNA (cytosine-5)-methyltransferase 1